MNIAIDKKKIAPKKPLFKTDAGQQKLEQIKEESVHASPAKTNNSKLPAIKQGSQQSPSPVKPLGKHTVNSKS